MWLPGYAGQDYDALSSNDWRIGDLAFLEEDSDVVKTPQSAPTRCVTCSVCVRRKRKPLSKRLFVY